MLLFSAFQSSDGFMDINKFSQQSKISQECYLLLVSVELQTVLSAPYASDTARLKVEKSRRLSNKIR